MFIGHYGPAVFDAHRTDGVKLWHAFLAVQAIDIVTSALGIFGIEGGPLEGGHPLAFNIPYSHSLVGSILISIVVALLYRVMRSGATRKSATVMGLLAFSHWPLDWLVHRPDLPIWPGGDSYLGLGLWDYAWPAYGLEVFFLGGMIAWWLSVTRGPRWTVIASWALVTVMSVMHFFIMTKPTLDLQQGIMPEEATGPVLSILAIVIFGIFTLAIGLIERGRTMKASS